MASRRGAKKPTAQDVRDNAHAEILAAALDDVAMAVLRPASGFHVFVYSPIAGSKVMGDLDHNLAVLIEVRDDVAHVRAQPTEGRFGYLASHNSMTSLGEFRWDDVTGIVAALAEVYPPLAPVLTRRNRR